MGIIGAGLQVLTLFIGKSETDITQALIKEQFRLTNAKIDGLSKKMEESFAELEKSLGDIVLDDLMRSLNRIQRSYSNYVNATQYNDNSFKNLKNKYADQFR